MHENKATTKSREPKDLNSYSTNESDQLNNSGHGVCEYMGATHSSQHTEPDAEHSSTCCCSTHEIWELPTPLIVANRSKQGDEVYGSYVLKTSILAKSDVYANILEKGDVFAHLSNFTQASKSSTKRSVSARGVQRYHSYFSRNCLPPAIGEDKAKSDVYANILEKGDVFAHLSNFTQASKSSTKRSVSARGVQRYHSYFSRNCLPPAIGEDKVR
ncbi:putative LRR receptor-like serine/threonine-protein kinase [Dorcoceras hygrometricum]|uniref:Putative LRR receptor-like serine/threonine-protein kinase n=1 Tax=Dorcoceras hygrometricum TaxID=472368 RepID=A0A2Z7C3Z1_9LAMI|nr:putative LRR receptor-like serine/threonine-protein kinase [Dorcoceras hygrometricum]